MFKRVMYQHHLLYLKIPYLHIAFRKHPVRGNRQSLPVWFTNTYLINLTSALMRTWHTKK